MTALEHPSDPPADDASEHASAAGALTGGETARGEAAGGGVGTVGGAGPARPSWWAIAAWIALAGVAVLLDGLVGGLAVVFVAAVLLAGLPPRWIGALGVLLLALAPIAFLAAGVPSESDVSPALVSRSLIPHHLTFSGLVLVSAFALIDLAPHLRAWASAPRPSPDDGPPLGVALGAAVVAVVAAGALWACWAVLGA